MAGNLPSGKWSAALIGAWWPQPPTALRTGAKQWQAQTTQQQHYAQDLRNTCMRLSSQNQGHTADDLISRYQQGEKQHLDLAEKYNVKADAFDKGADAIDALRDGLKGIAREYGQKIEQIEHSKGGGWALLLRSRSSLRLNR